MIKGRLYICSTYSICQGFTSPFSVRAGDYFKDIAKPERIPVEYWRRILWMAVDLKKTVLENNKINLKLLETKHVTLLFGKPHGRFQLAFTLACDMLGARKTLYHDSNFENQPNPADTGKVLSRLTDMFIIHGLHHDVLVKLASEATLPIFSASCNIYCLQKALSDLMTFQEKHNRLKGLILAWVGPPTSIFNAYLLLCPQFGIRIQYICICSYGSGKMSPVHKFSDKKICNSTEETVKEFKTAKEAVTGAHIIATSLHRDDRNKIDLELLKNAEKNWFFMHTLPRTAREVSDDVFHNKNNLCWETSENYLYVAMAVILTNLCDYVPKSKIPNFDGTQEEPDTGTASSTP